MTKKLDELLGEDFIANIDDYSSRDLGEHFYMLAEGASKEYREIQTELANYKKHADLIACSYCGHEIKKSETSNVEMLHHIATCEKRPEKAILQRAFEVNDMLIKWLEHVAGVGSPIEIKLITGGTHTIEASPHYFTDCETCKQIAGYLARYHESGDPS